MTNINYREGDSKFIYMLNLKWHLVRMYGMVAKGDKLRTAMSMILE